MAENIQLNKGQGGDVFAADSIDDVKFSRSKITIGRDGENDGDVSKHNPMPVELSGTSASSEQIMMDILVEMRLLNLRFKETFNNISELSDLDSEESL